MPVSVATDRSNNTESCLVLVLLLAAWALLAAAERGSRWLLLLSGVLISLGFNVKMLAAFVVLPAFALVYLLGEPARWRRRIADLALAGLVLVTLSLSWAVVYDLTPPDRRPFAGSTKGNSMVELAVDHNGLGRFVRLSASRCGSAGPAAVSSRSNGVAGRLASQGPGDDGRGFRARPWARFASPTVSSRARSAGSCPGRFSESPPASSGRAGDSRDPLRMSLLL
jgi:4-amino-4-deoxy-L-arabinose transferase-like glycosyltransferase